MKKITLVLAMMLIGLTSVSATESTVNLVNEDLRITNRYRSTQPIVFVERGVEFFIFSNGKFDFNTNRSYRNFDNHYQGRRKTRRGSFNINFGAPGISFNVSHTHSRGTHVLYDRYGRIHKIGSVHIDYDHHGRVKHIGSVHIKYHHGLLERVGDLRITYNRWGDIIDIHGHVNHSNQGCGFCGITGCTTDHFYRGSDNNWNDHDEDWDDHDGRDDYYDDDYYHKKGRKKNNKRKRRQ